MANCLIIGYGRAGRRHAQYAEHMGLTVATVDPNPATSANYLDWRVALQESNWDRVVIASPPNMHIMQLTACAELGVPVLCEKPLCDLEQLNLLAYAKLPKQLMVAYNWLWHPQIEALREVSRLMEYDELKIRSVQYRAELPNWSLLIDHISHALVMTAYITGEDELAVTDALHNVNDYYQSIALREYWLVNGEFYSGHGRFRLVDGVTVAPTERVNDISLARDSERLCHMNVQPDKQMFARMWSEYMAGTDTKNTVKLALNVQAALEAAWQIAK